MDVGAVCRRKDHRRDGHRPSRSGRRAACSCLLGISRLHLGTWFRESPPHTRRTHRAAAGVLLVSLPGVTPGVTPGTITNGRASPALSPRPPPPGATPAAGASAPGRAVRRGVRRDVRAEAAVAKRPQGVSGEWCHPVKLPPRPRVHAARGPARCCRLAGLDHAPPPAAGAVERRSRPGVPLA